MQDSPTDGRFEPWDLDSGPLRVLLDTVQAPVLMLDPAGRILRFNPAFESLTGYSEGEVRGRPLSDFLEAPAGAAALPAGDAAAGLQRADWVTRSGARRPIAWSSSTVPGPDGGPQHRIVTGMDLSAGLRADAALAALRASETRYAGIVSLAADAIISVDGEQRVVLFNEGAQEIFGWTAEEVMGQPLEMLLPARYREVHRSVHLPAFAGSATPSRRMGERREIWGLRKNGEEFPAEASISRLVVGDERVFTVLLRDVTVQKRLERAQRFLIDAGVVLASSLDYTLTLRALARLVVDGLADLCVIDMVSADGSVSRLEAAHREPGMRGLARRLAEYPLDRDRDHLVSDVLRTRAPTLVREVTPEVLDRVAQNPEHRSIIEAFSPVSYMVVPLLARDQLLGVILCVSSCRRYDHDDVELAQELARRAALAVDNARLYEEAQHAVQARDDVVSIVAHDLGNPLSAIRIATSLLLRTAADVEQGTLMWQQLGAIRSCAENMERLITSLLDLRRIEAGRLVLDRRVFAPAALLDRVVPALHLLAHERGIHLEVRSCEELPSVEVDVDRMVQVLENIIGNALKFTPSGGTVVVEAGRAEGCVQFAVADTGPGIHPDQLPHLFDRFWQARHSSRRSVGLGLSIARGIAEGHGGAIRVESEPGRGATFRVLIPAAGMEQATSSRRA
jgi:PAS domain S-box-containing protein